MNETVINKIQPDPGNLDFDGFRKEGISLVQEMSGDVWTDYNLHDPGVTVLEQLCYALTDLVYRTRFDIADYLATDEQGLDCEALALYRPDDVLPSRAVTDNDYRKLFLDAIPNLDNVWVEREASAISGIRRVFLLLNEGVKDQNNPGVRKAYGDIVRKYYEANRNLCEDLGEIEILDRTPYSLCGEIEIEGKKDASIILAEACFVCAHYMSQRVSPHPYHEEFERGRDMEELFTGVLMRHGYIPDEELYPWRTEFSVAEAVGKIGAVEGVKNVRRLSFVNGSGEEMDHIDSTGKMTTRSVIGIEPLRSGSLGISVFRAGKRCRVDPLDVKTEFDRLIFRYQASRNGTQVFDWVKAGLPKPNRRAFQEYFSIQNQFPNVYGLNAGGLPESASPQRRAQAMQLKAYLLLFEQLMANFLQDIQSLPRLFSLDENLKRTYFHQVLDDDVVPDVEAVYQGDLESLDTQLEAVLSGFDNFEDRRNRVLDYLLALHGEKFNQNSLRVFFPDDLDTEKLKIRNKLAYLKVIRDISKNRGAAENYHKVAGYSEGCGLKKKLTLLLGLDQTSGLEWDKLFPSGTREEDLLHVIEHIQLRPRGNKAHDGVSDPESCYAFRISVVFPELNRNEAGNEFRGLLRETVDMNCPAHIYAGIVWLDPERYIHFDRLYRTWREARQAADVGVLDQAAGELLHFLSPSEVAKNG